MMTMESKRGIKGHDGNEDEGERVLCSEDTGPMVLEGHCWQVLRTLDCPAANHNPDILPFDSSEGKGAEYGVINRALFRG